jgi:hypothetical protein
MVVDLTGTAIHWSRRHRTWRRLCEPFNPTRFPVEPIVHHTAHAASLKHISTADPSRLPAPRTACSNAPGNIARGARRPRH